MIIYLHLRSVAITGRVRQSVFSLVYALRLKKEFLPLTQSIFSIKYTRRTKTQLSIKHRECLMAAVTVYSAPEDGRKGRPKHVEHTCSF